MARQSSKFDRHGTSKPQTFAHSNRIIQKDCLSINTITIYNVRMSHTHIKRTCTDVHTGTERVHNIGKGGGLQLIDKLVLLHQFDVGVIINKA